MDESFEKTFIPRKRMNPMSAGLKVESTISVFSTVALLLFSLAFFASIGIFVTGFFIEKKTDELRLQTTKDTAVLDKSEIEKIVSLDKKVTAVGTILNDHVSLSKILGFLESVTSARVMIDDFNYIGENGRTQTVTINGTAKNYNTLANQSKIFKENTMISKVAISNIEPNDVGEILFMAELEIKNGVFAFKEKK